ncbi:winged helix-turn-helix transcriptional regulator [Salmonella enterica]|uniref:Winged helix-turn-helix transcriptional regulator n=1 Tax=Salmonella enterica subsp. VII serovar 40:z4,z24:[z39] TaxID=1967625 RepID=A0A731XST1_SALEE|nr:MarR family transcriptional regulator [Salmonella enterica]EDO5295359.1 MarR family transcriptional regulator [Salmonella enterica subsp. houtenae serovar 40:z4,z24:-]EDS6439047.1 winged helix-turn-helix transcriptional regulator [Salmonella enterica subsp. VII str. CFSAN000550]EDT6888130.1 winged helix-turn-helix transcriptional regulator [Salmonella enterica subsp. enterica]EDU7899048.1 winged helix-turn-helix transcriptional regulator [Salmonella enterica subsp. houtenae]QJY65755.1 winge
MSENKNVQDTHISEQMKVLHGALIRIVSALNQPRNDEKLIEDAGIQLDRALFSILISIERLGPIGVVELAERAGRDYTTVSRQVAKLEKLRLVIRQHNAVDRRIREAVISPTGKAMTERIDAAREQMGNVIFKGWSQDELDIFVRLMQKFADAMDSVSSTQS